MKVMKRITIVLLALIMLQQHMCYADVKYDENNICQKCGRHMLSHDGIGLYGNASIKKIRKTKWVKSVRKAGKGKYIVKTKTLKLYDNISKKYKKRKTGGINVEFFVDGPLVYGAGMATVYRKTSQDKEFPKGTTKLIIKLTKNELKKIKKERLTKKGKKRMFKYWTKKGEMAMNMSQKEARNEFKKRYYKKGDYYYPYVKITIKGGVWQGSFIDYTKCGGGYSGHEGWLEFGKSQTFRLKTY